MLSIFLLLGLVILIGVAGHMLFKYTKVPESLFMIIMGLIAGPLLQVVNQSDLERLVPLIVLFSLVVILLDSGLSTNIFELVKTLRRASLFTFIVFAVTTALAWSFMHYFVGWGVLYALFVGVICSGTTTITVIYLLSKVTVTEEVRQLLILESIINDITIIAAATFIIQAIELELAGVEYTFHLIFWYVGMGVTFGLVLSFLWANMLGRFFKERRLIYVSTLAIAIILYSLTEIIKGSGVVALLAFTLLLGNLISLNERFNLNMEFTGRLQGILDSIKTAQAEVAFSVKNFFFFVLGALFRLENARFDLFAICLVLIALMVFSRFMSAEFLSLMDKRYAGYTLLIAIMLPRGFTATLAAFMPIGKNIEVPLITEIVLTMVLLSTLTATFGSMIFERKLKAKTEAERSKEANMNVDCSHTYTVPGL